MLHDSYSAKVSNGNDFDIRDFYDGIPYVIPAVGKAKIPQTAFIHIFGSWFFNLDAEGNEVPNDRMRDEIFLHLQKRFGWNLTPPSDERGLKTWVDPKAKFERLKFDLISLDMREKVIEIESLAKPRPQPFEQKPNEEIA